MYRVYTIDQIGEDEDEESGFCSPIQGEEKLLVESLSLDEVSKVGYSHWEKLEMEYFNCMFIRITEVFEAGEKNILRLVYDKEGGLVWQFMD